MPVERSKPCLAHANWIVVGLLVLLAVVGLFAVEWATYGSFDQEIFDVRAAVLALLRTVLDALA